MTLIANIRSTLAGVSAAFADVGIEVRTITSSPTANPRTYSPWEAITVGRITDVSSSQTQDIDTGVWYNFETCKLRIPFDNTDSPSLAARVTQVRVNGPAGKVWVVDQERTEGAGSVRVYILHIRTPLMANPRKGGV